MIEVIFRGMNGDDGGVDAAATGMKEIELTNEVILEALKHCIGAADIGEERCEGCPLYADHYCVDTLYSVIREKIEGRPEGSAFGWKVD